MKKIFITITLLIQYSLLALAVDQKPVVTGADAVPQPVDTQTSINKFASKTYDIVGDSPLTIEGSMKLRDPFTKPTLKNGSENEGGLIPELERYSVEQMKLAGVITGTKKNKAMIVTPDNKMHIVSEKEKIGNRNGFVKRIVMGKVLVEEKIINLLGKEEKAESVIEFPEKKKL